MPTTSAGRTVGLSRSRQPPCASSAAAAFSISRSSATTSR